MVLTTYVMMLACMLICQRLCLLLQLTKGKSAGMDGLNGESLKHADPLLPLLLSLCFTCMFKHSYLPTDMLSSIIIPLVKNKSGDLSDKNNYRPIALSSIISKVFEHIILQRLEAYLWTNDNQFGFKTSHSTDLCVYALCEFIEYFKSRSTSVFISFLDASKAFDKINHWTLFRKLLNRSVPIYLVKILCYWYQNQYMFVRWGTKFSSKFSVSNGVRQGGVLSPCLFNVYVDGLSDILNATSIGGTIGGKLINHMFYADDLCVISLSSESMQMLLNKCNHYCNSHDLVFNVKKSVCMFYKCCVNKKCDNPVLYLNGNKIDFVQETKYLGVNLSSSMKTTIDVSRQTRKFYAQANMLLRNFCHCDRKTKCILFRSFCTNMYCCTLWFRSTKTSLNKLRVSYNNVLRRLLGISKPYSASAMFVTQQLPSFFELLRQCIFRFIKRIENSTNTFVSACNCPLLLMHSPIRNWWRTLLFIT